MRESAYIEIIFVIARCSAVNLSHKLDLRVRKSSFGSDKTAEPANDSLT